MRRFLFACIALALPDLVWAQPSQNTSPTPASIGAVALGAPVDQNTVAGRTNAIRAAERINVKDMGGVGNAIRLIDAAMTAGSSTASSNTASFQQSDVGKYVEVVGSGASGANQTGTILNVTDAHHVTVSFSATTAVTAAVAIYGTDDSAALAAAITAENARMIAGSYPCIYAPGSNYLIGTGTPIPQFATGYPGCVTGDGHNRSQFFLATGFSGDIFAWSESWFNQSNYGAAVVGLSIIGAAGGTNIQDGLMFYDRDDDVYVNDVELDTLNGYGIGTGIMKNQVEAYMRESRFSNIKVSSSGTPSMPAVLFASQCTGTPCTSSDASNEIDIAGMSIYGQPGAGLVLSNTISGNPLRQFRMNRLRIEGREGYSGAGDLLDIGDGSATHAITNITCSDCELVSPYTGYSAFVTQVGTGGTAPVTVSYFGRILAGANGGSGINIKAGSGIYAKLEQMGTTATNVTVASSATVAYPITIDGNGQDQYWTYNIDPTSFSFVRRPGNVVGDPTNSNKRYIAATFSDGTANWGNVRGANAVDWQLSRFAASQVASGVGSVVAGGEDNTAQSTDCFEGGGALNTCAGFRGTLSGGYGGTVAGQYATIAGGFYNYLSGNYSSIPGGLYANDRGRYAWQGWGAGEFSTSGDSETGEQLLRGIGATASAIRGTADAAAAGSANIMNITTTTHYHLFLSASCRDTTANTFASWDGVWGDLDRTTGTTTTYTGGYATAAAPSRSTGTLSAMTFTVTADTTNSGLNVSWAPVSSNTDTLHCLAHVQSREELQ